MLIPLKDRFPLTSRLEILITSYNVHLIIAFITLPSLIWHISSTHIHDDYGMPDDWIEAFDKTQFTGGRGWLWGFLFAVIPIDCVHALLALDYYHGRRYERGYGGDTTNPYKENKTRRSRSRSSASTRTTTSHHFANTTASKSPAATIASLPTQPTRTYHPLLTPLFSPKLSLFLIILYDVTITTFLVIHITMFFYLLDANWEACNLYSSPYPESFMDPMSTGMSVVDRCQRINTDMYVSGGFDVALCVILLAVHLWHLGFRAWEAAVFGFKEDSKTLAENTRFVDGSEESQRLVDLDERGDNVRSTAIRYRDWEAEEIRRRMRISMRSGTSARQERSSSVESAKWSEVLLECLVP